jgi:hypothetical protein
MEDQFVGDLEKAKPISRQRNHFHCNYSTDLSVTGSRHDVIMHFRIWSWSISAFCRWLLPGRCCSFEVQLSCSVSQIRNLSRTVHNAASELTRWRCCDGVF